MESWKVTEDVLFHAALENTPCLQKACVVNMEQVCRGILEEKDSDLGIPKMMNIMTNANRTNDKLYEALINWKPNYHKCD